MGETGPHKRVQEEPPTRLFEIAQLDTEERAKLQTEEKERRARITGEILRLKQEAENVPAVEKESDKEIAKRAEQLLAVWTEDADNSTATEKMEAKNTDKVASQEEIEVTDADIVDEQEDVTELTDADMEDVRSLDKPDIPPLPSAAISVEDGSGGSGGGEGGEPPTPESAPSAETLEIKVRSLKGALDNILRHAENWPQTAKEKKEQKALKRWLKKGGKGEWPVSDKLTTKNYKEILTDVGVTSAAVALLDIRNLRAGESPFSFVSRELSRYQRALSEAGASEFDQDLNDLEQAVESSVSGGIMELSEEGDEYPEMSDEQKAERLKKLWEMHGIDGDMSMSVGSMSVGDEVKVRAENGDLLSGILVHVKLDGSRAAVAMPDETLKIISKEDLFNWNNQGGKVESASEDQEVEAVEEDQTDDSAATEDETSEETEIEQEDEEGEDYTIIAEIEVGNIRAAITLQGGKYYLWLADEQDEGFARIDIDVGVGDFDADRAVEEVNDILQEHPDMSLGEYQQLIEAFWSTESHEYERLSALLKQEPEAAPDKEDALDAMDEFLGESGGEEVSEEVEQEASSDFQAFLNGAIGEGYLSGSLISAWEDAGKSYGELEMLLKNIQADQMHWEAKGAKSFVARKQALSNGLEAVREHVRVHADWLKDLYVRYGEWISSPESSEEEILEQSSEEAKSEEQEQSTESDKEILERKKIWDDWVESLKNTSAGMKKIVEAKDWSYFEKAIANNDADISEMMNHTKEVLSFVRTKADSEALQASLGQIDLRLGHRKDAKRGFRVMIPDIGQRYDSKTMEIVRQDESSQSPGTVLGIEGIGITLPDGTTMAGGRARVATAR